MSNLAKLKKKATEYEQSRQFDKALAAYEDILRAQDGSEEADIALYNRVGDLQARQGRSADALRSYEQAADLYAERGFLNNAIALYSKVLRQSPSNGEVQLKLGKLSASKGFRSDARRHFAAYLTSVQRSGRLDAGFVALRSFAESAPESEDARQLLAELLVDFGRVTEAVEQLRPVLDSFERQHRHAEAQAVRERLRALDPSFVGGDAMAGLSADGDVGLGAASFPPISRQEAAPRAAAGAPGSVDGLVLFEPSDAPFSSAAERAVTPESLSLVEGHDDGFRLEAGRVVETTAADALGEALVTDGLEVFGGSIAEPPVEPVSLDGFTATADGGQPSGTEESRVGVPTDLIRGADFVSAEFGAPEDGGAAPEPGILLDLSHASDLGAGAAADAPVAAAEGFETTEVQESHGAELELVVFEPAVAETRVADAVPEADDAWVTAPEDAPAAGAGEGSELTFYAPDEEQAPAPRPELGLMVSAAPGDVLEAVEEKAPAARPALALVTDDAALPAFDEPLPAVAAPAPTRDDTPVPPAPRPAAPADLPPRAAAASSDALLDFSRQLDADGPRPWQQPAEPAPASDFVNLGDWLRADEAPVSTRMVTEERAPSGDEQADFAEMLRKFKQGVAENVGHEDYDSHYDLGVAFKEMGLVDEAIAAFQKALRGPSNRTRVYEALGQCFLEKGQHTIASSILQRAVGEPGTDDQQLVGVLYLLGRAAEATHQKSEALRYYQRVFAVDIEFSDVAQRIGLVEQVSQ